MKEPCDGAAGALRRYNPVAMVSRITTLLLVMVLTWAGFSTQVQARPTAWGAVDAVAAQVGQATPTDTERKPLEPGAQAQPEGLADLPVVIPQRPPATVPAALPGWPGPAALTGWASACLEGLQRPPCAARTAV